MMRMDNSSKHEALVKAKALINGESVAVVQAKTKAAKVNTAAADFKKYVSALKKHEEALAFCKKRCLNVAALNLVIKGRKTVDKWGRGCLIFSITR